MNEINLDVIVLKKMEERQEYEMYKNKKNRELCVYIC